MIIDPKKALRTHWREALESVSYKKFLAAQADLAGQLASFLKEKAKADSIVAGFRSRAECGEAGLEPLFTAAGSLPGIRWCFPIAKDGGIMEFHETQVPVRAQDFKKSLWEILEPVPATPKADIPSIHVVLIPLLAFDKQGTRLGQGKGYYDRFLLKTKAIRVGVAFSWQEASEPLPAEMHDCPLDMVCTEKGFRRFKS